MPLLDSALKLGSKALTLGGKVFGLGKGRLPFRDKKLAGMGWSKTVKGNKLGATGQMAAKIAAVGGGTNLLQNAIGDAGPEGDEFQERAYNQLRYGVDMTDAQMEEAAAKGQQFQDTGAIGEGGLNEEQVLKYLEQESQDKRGGLEKAASTGLSALSMVPGLGTLLGTPSEMIYDKFTGDTRRVGLKNAVDSLKLDANAMKTRREMEKKQGKFMTQGLLGNDFGTGNVSGINRGGIKPPVDREAQAEEASALKEYEAIKARDGVFAAFASPAALKAGRQVYLDVQEAADGDKNTAEALLSGVGGQEGVGLTDQATMEKYYGNAKNNAASNQKLADEAIAKQSAAQQAIASASAQTSLEAQDRARSGEISISPATNPEEVVNNQATIATQKGFYGQNPNSIQQQAYLNARGQKSAMQMENSLNSPEWQALFQRHQRQATANAQAAREYIAPQHRMGVSPTGQVSRDAEAARVFGGNTPPAIPSVSAQVNESAKTPGIPSNVAPARPNPGLVPPVVPGTQGQANANPGMTPEQKYGPQALDSAKRNGFFLGTNPNIMKPTPYGLGTATPGVPQVPDIGGPARRFAENATTMQGSPGSPMPVMKASPYGLGTATPGVPSSIPQGIPDIGAPVRNAVQGALTQQSSPPGVAPKKPMSQEEIAKMIAEQEQKKVEARNNANPQISPIPRPNPMRRFR